MTIRHIASLPIPRPARRGRKLAAALLMIAVTVLTNTPATADLQDIRPDREHSPELVISIIVKSLQMNDPENDAGIATVYRFASPANRLSTGPLARFSQMIKRGYPNMLNHVRARYTPIEVSDDRAVQTVWLSTARGQENGYAFHLSRQASGEFDGMWMTDAVIPLGRNTAEEIRI